MLPDIIRSSIIRVICRETTAIITARSWNLSAARPFCLVSKHIQQAENDIKGPDPYPLPYPGDFDCCGQAGTASQSKEWVFLCLNPSPTPVRKKNSSPNRPPMTRKPSHWGAWVPYAPTITVLQGMEKGCFREDSRRHPFTV